MINDHLGGCESKDDSFVASYFFSFFSLYVGEEGKQSVVKGVA